MGEATAVRERPILFSGPMVRANLDGSKTQTRRVVDRIATVGRVTEFQPSDTPGYDWKARHRSMLWYDMRHADLMQRCPYGQPGDRLWVRETWMRACGHAEDDGTVCIAYRADQSDGRGGLVVRNIERADKEWQEDARWRPSIHMPRWASRITLEITGVRVERLHDISADDAVAEGVRCWVCGGPVDGSCENDCACFHTRSNARPSFEVLWNEINAARGYGWDANPWVWVITFRRTTQEDSNG